jgi:hypothetical protein
MVGQSSGRDEKSTLELAVDKLSEASQATEVAWDLYQARNAPPKEKLDATVEALQYVNKQANTNPLSATITERGLKVVESITLGAMDRLSDAFSRADYVLSPSGQPRSPSLPSGGPAALGPLVPAESARLDAQRAADARQAREFGYRYDSDQAFREEAYRADQRRANPEISYLFPVLNEKAYEDYLRLMSPAQVPEEEREKAALALDSDPTSTGERPLYPITGSAGSDGGGPSRPVLVPAETENSFLRKPDDTSEIGDLPSYTKGAMPCSDGTVSPSGRCPDSILPKPEKSGWDELSRSAARSPSDGDHSGSATAPPLRDIFSDRGEMQQPLVGDWSAGSGESRPSLPKVAHRLTRPLEWDRIQTPEVRQMAKVANIEAAIQRAGSAAAALAAATGLLGQAQSQLRDAESAFQQTAAQISPGAVPVYTPNPQTMIAARGNEVILRRDMVAYLSGVVSALRGIQQTDSSRTPFTDESTGAIEPRPAGNPKQPSFPGNRTTGPSRQDVDGELMAYYKKQCAESPYLQPGDCASGDPRVYGPCLYRCPSKPQTTGPGVVH